MKKPTGRLDWVKNSAGAMSRLLPDVAPASLLCNPSESARYYIAASRRFFFLCFSFFSFDCSLRFY